MTRTRLRRYKTGGLASSPAPWAKAKHSWKPVVGAASSAPWLKGHKAGGLASSPAPWAKAKRSWKPVVGAASSLHP